MRMADGARHRPDPRPRYRIGGRVSKRDVARHISKRCARDRAAAGAAARRGAAAPTAGAAHRAASRARSGAGRRATLPPVGSPAVAGYRPPVYEPREGDMVEPFTRRRKLIAEHMVYSKTHSPHVGTLAEVDLTRVMRLRESHKDVFAGAARASR